MFIQVDRSAHTPAYLQIDESIRTLIQRGALRPGAKLPSTRDLARDLGVNRITVSRAFQRLETDGLIASKVGDGTYVRPASRQSPVATQVPLGVDEDAALRVWGPLFVNPRSAPRALPSVPPRKGAGAASFVYAAPPADLFPAEEFRRCTDYVLKRRIPEICRVGAADGLAALKEHLIGWLAQHGIAATDRNLIITTGCQQSLDLIRKILVQPGDPLILENPTFPGAVGALCPSGMGLLELPVLDTGADLRVLKARTPRQPGKLVYVSPNFHNPTGQTMPLETRRELAEIAMQSRMPIIEDDVFGQLRYEGPSQPALQSLCPDLVIYVGSFSKMLSPGLRVGWIVAPKPVAEQLVLAKQSSDLHTGMLIQAAMDEFCRRGLMLRHLKRVRRIFKSRRDAMAEALHRHFPQDARWKPPEGGLSMWVTLPGDFDTEELLSAAQDRGVQFLPGGVFYFRSAAGSSMRLSFATENEQAITSGIRTLGEILSKRRPRTLRPERRPIL